MTITTSRVGAVIDALISKLNASSTFADPVRVFDGPVTQSDTMWTQAVFVGFDGDWRTDTKGTVTAHTEYPVAAVAQEMVYLGNTTMREELDIVCSAEAWTGDATPKTARDLCLSMLAGVETVLRTDPALGIAGLGTVATLHAGNLSYVFDEGGNLAARLPFTVHVINTITTV